MDYKSLLDIALALFQFFAGALLIIVMSSFRRVNRRLDDLAEKITAMRVAIARLVPERRAANVGHEPERRAAMHIDLLDKDR